MAFQVPTLNPWLIFLVLLNAYVLLLYLLVKKGWLARLGMSLFGPALMIKTQRGRWLLDWFARARGLFDRAAGFGIYLTGFVMIVMSLLLVVQLFFIFSPDIPPPSPRLILGIPGFNPLIPVTYGIFALIFAVVVHEFSHGILARVHQLRVKTMGILLLIIPVGAFVEPDEEQLKAAPRRVRVKVFSAGPTSNLFFALLFAVLFSPLVMGSVHPAPGAVIHGVEVDGPACQAGLLPGWTITHINNRPQRQGAVDVTDWESLSRMIDAEGPNSTIHFFVKDASVPQGLDDQSCINPTNMKAGVFPVTTRRCSEQYENETCQATGQSIQHRDPLNRTVIGVAPYPTDRVLSLLANPLQSPAAAMNFIVLPFYSLTGNFPLTGSYPGYYETPFDADVFWVVANSLYWLFWINLMLGLTNALPILPLDGGYMFRDFVGHGLKRLRPGLSAEAADRLVGRISLFVALFLVTLVLMQFVGPYLARLFW